MAEIVLSSNTIIEEINAITSAGTFAVAHCVSEDFLMSRGVAVQFKLNYGQVGVLLDQRVRVGGVAELKVHQENGFYIFYLVTKVLYHQKPTIQSLATTLVQLRDRLKELSINSLIIPKLGCMLDQLNWYQVHALIKTTFDSSDDLQQLKITVCDPENFQIPSHYVASIEEKRIDLFDVSTNFTVKILPVEITCASTNTLFQKCLANKLLRPELWATVRLGQVVRVSDTFVIWAIQGDDVTFFQTLEAQINETVAIGLDSFIWAFPKSEMIHYAAFLSLVR
eukprot:XP_016661426.1 PREDICTED: uncharacterized protein LOC107884251 [Acyrthosiphon pisum]